jgi:hypothetical protein
MGHSPSSPVPAFRKINRVPRHRGHVLDGGKTPLPLDEEGRSWHSIAVIESAFAVVSLALDEGAPWLVVESWLFSIAAGGGFVELVSDLFIGGHV